MRKALLLRIETSDQGTFGLLGAEGFLISRMAELPWRDNIKQMSCIPEGSYIVKWHKSPKFGLVYKVFDVPSRNEILIHKGNFVGASDKGYKTNSHGCLLPCLKLGSIKGQKAGLLSLPAVSKIEEFFNRENFELEIKNAYRTSSLTE